MLILKTGIEAIADHPKKKSRSGNEKCTLPYGAG